MSNLFNRLRSGAEQAVGKAAFEADKLRRIAAEQTSIKDLREEARKLTVEAGHVAYKLYGRQQIEQPELLQVCRQIEGVEEQIAEHEKRLEAVRAEEFVEQGPAPQGYAAQYGRICPHGHGAIAAGANFCERCGAAAVYAPPPQEVICENCGAGLAAGAGFCTDCGQQVTATAAAASCAVCGSAVHPSMRFCGTCGAPVEALAPPPAPDSANAPWMKAPASYAPPGEGYAADAPTRRLGSLRQDTMERSAWRDDEQPALDEEGEWQAAAQEHESDAADEVAGAEDEFWAGDAPQGETAEGDESWGGIAAPGLDEPTLFTSETLVAGLSVLPEIEGATQGRGYAEGEADGEEDAAAATAAAATRAADCPICGHTRLADALFCENCGFQFEDVKEEPAEVEAPVAAEASAVEEVDGMTCPNCKMPVEADGMFCAECGYQLSELA